MLYNVIYEVLNINVDNKPIKITGLKLNKLEEFVKAYENGNETFFFSGVTYGLSRLNKVKIYDTSKHNFNSKDEIDDYYRKVDKMWGIPTHLSQFGIDITEEYIKGVFGYKNNLFKVSTGACGNSVYINQSRINELRNIENSNFDLKKLIRLCEEINISYQNNCYYSVGILVRAIIDHIPPVFSCANFDAVANNYKSDGNSRSFTNSMKQLNSPMRFISDASIHSQIRKSESLPNETQIDCKKELDVLLAEVIRVLRT
ncbi:MAG: hypothetical protein A2033_18795 [Bacteroidetes bacterium GWA2_31_9]|nr:MAG: hypothetical protein A2033_18795 [Bacteroidetes bacterium GWA2_31_9]